MTDDPFHPLDSPKAFEAALARSEQGPVVLFKHSVTCPLSARAQREMEALAREVDAPVYRLVVQRDRALSNAIAEALRVRHESPQVFVVHHCGVAFHTSHGGVRADAVRSALSAPSTVSE